LKTFHLRYGVPGGHPHLRGREDKIWVWLPIDTQEPNLIKALWECGAAKFKDICEGWEMKVYLGV
jgi:hypothetical protein